MESTQSLVWQVFRPCCTWYSTYPEPKCNGGLNYDTYVHAHVKRLARTKGPIPRGLCVNARRSIVADGRCSIKLKCISFMLIIAGLLSTSAWACQAQKDNYWRVRTRLRSRHLRMWKLAYKGIQTLAVMVISTCKKYSGAPGNSTSASILTSPSQSPSLQRQ